MNNIYVVSKNKNKKYLAKALGIVPIGTEV